jgi:FlaA1/EpsC-like NDP-sugar epimerase
MTGSEMATPSFDGKKILVIGGTGTLGRAMVHRLLAGPGMPRKVVIMSRDEAKQYDMRAEFGRLADVQRVLDFRIGDIRDFAAVSSALKGVDIVFFAAALKQVPSCEYFPEQAVLTNCLGASNLVRAIRERHDRVETVVCVSSDKACQPFNVMGMTKAIQERLFVAANLMCANTRFIGVRYGNIIASRGSFIPLILDQIRRGGPVTLTDPRMTRFLLGLDDALDTIFAAIRDALRGEIYVPEAPAASVMNIAAALIGDRRIAIETIGARPGEKMHEILVSDEEAQRCYRRGVYLVIPPMLPELTRDNVPAVPALAGELNSSARVVSAGETAGLLRRHGFLEPAAVPA